MYCPSCGAESVQGLRYCKQCGANLNTPATVEPPRRLHPIVIMSFLVLMGLITMVGLIIPLAASNDLRSNGFNPNEIMQVFSISAVVALALDAMLIWLLLKLIKTYQHPHGPAQARDSKPQAVNEITPAQLAAPPPAIGSVTEHTTRNFDEYEKTIRARQAGRDTNEV
jgi:hypothetical protein